MNVNRINSSENRSFVNFQLIFYRDPKKTAASMNNVENLGACL
jgi:hypothetical protein